MLRRIVATFGNGDCGRLGHGGELGEVIPTVVQALLDLNIKDISAGGAHTAVLADDGTVLTFGLNDRGQLGHNPRQAYIPIPQEVPLPEPATLVSCGHYHTLATTESGNVWAWGCNKRGQLGFGADNNSSGSISEPRLIHSLQGMNIAAISAGADHSLALTTGGEVYSWGCADDGKLGHGLSSGWKVLQGIDEPKPRVIRALQTLKIRHISAGHMHSGCVSDDDRLFVFGNSMFHQLGLGVAENQYKPTQIPNLRNANKVACGGLHTLLALHDGSIFSFGANQNGSLGLGHQKQQDARVPAYVPGIAGEQVSAGWKHSTVVTSEGRLYTFGWGGSQGSALSFQGDQSGGGGQLGLGDEFDYWQPTHVADLALPNGSILPQERHAAGNDLAWRVLKVSCGLNHTVAMIELSSRVPTNESLFTPS